MASATVSKIYLMCSEEDRPLLQQAISARDPRIEVIHTPDIASLRAKLPVDTQGIRLVAFMSAVIVPADILERFDLGAYNFHPGTPEFPGTAPEAWASYQQVPVYGATAHVMTAKVDEGPIIKVEELPVPRMSPRLVYAQVANRAAHALFSQMADALCKAEPLPVDDALTWTGTKHSSADFQKMCQIEPDITHEELIRRMFCFGPPDVAEFSITLHGHKFVMLTQSGIKGYMDPPLPDNGIVGWAWDMVHPKRRLELSIVVDDSREFVTTADVFRQDVRDAGQGDGASGFSWYPPADLCDGLPHKVDVLASGFRLLGSPRLVVFRKDETPWKKAPTVTL